jgi:ketosteroid isomerase-like protein
MFAEIPDLRMEVLRAAVSGDEVWTELRVHGSKLDGTPFEYRGVTIWGIAADRIASARFYFEVVEADSPDIDTRMQQVLGDG